jgi:hypothetical protein
VGVLGPIADHRLGPHAVVGAVALGLARPFKLLVAEHLFWGGSSFFSYLFIFYSQFLGDFEHKKILF